MAQVDITFFDRSGPETTDDVLRRFLQIVYYAVGQLVYCKSDRELKAADVTVLPHRAHPAAVSGADIEVKVELASDDWLPTKEAYDELAADLHRALAAQWSHEKVLFVWITGGPFTGFAEGPGFVRD